MQKRIAYVATAVDATAGGFLSGIDKRFKAFVLMAGDLSDEVDKTTKGFQEYRQKRGRTGKTGYIHEQIRLDGLPGNMSITQRPRLCFLQYATGDEPFLRRRDGEALLRKSFSGKPKRLKIYERRRTRSTPSHARSHRFSCGAAFL